jgi:hypothetical protein
MSRSLGAGSYLRKCPVCGYPITAHSHALTAHEEDCIRRLFLVAGPHQQVDPIDGDG